MYTPRTVQFLYIILSAPGLHYNEALDRESRNELLNEIRTTYTPAEDLPFKQSFSGTNNRYNKRNRQRRKLHRHRSNVKLPRFWSTQIESKKRLFRRKATYTHLKNSTGHLVYEALWKKQMNASEVKQLQGSCLSIYLSNIYVHAMFIAILIKLATTMMRYMDFTVDPCDNFFDFACGNWENYNFIPGDRTEYDTFELLREGLDAAMKDVLSDEEHLLDGVHNDDARVKAIHLYRSCMNLGLMDLMDLIELLLC